MTSPLTEDTEVRNIPSSDKHSLGQRIRYDPSIKKFMLSIPKNIDDYEKPVGEYDKKYEEKHFK